MAGRESRFYRRLNNLKGRMADRESRETESKNVPTTKKGGFINILFILVNEACQKVVSHGLLYNIVIYLTKEYHVPAAEANNAVFYWNAATDCMTVLCGFISESCMGRFAFIGFGSVGSLLGIFLLWLTAIVPALRPPPCTPSGCTPPTTAQLSYLIPAFSLISIGASCVSCSTAFAVDQLEGADKSEDKRALERLFMYYHASSSFIIITAKTATTYILDEYGWQTAFGLQLIVVVLFVIMFFRRSPLYCKVKPKRSLLASLSQVLVAACRNRDLPFPSPNSSGRYHSERDSKIVQPTDHLRILNKACTIRDAQHDVGSNGSAIDPWKLCTAEQVEEAKALAKVLPLWSTGIMMWVNVSENKFMLLQASSMDREISQDITIPRAAFAMSSVIIMMLGVSLYDRGILPLASRIKGEPICIGVKKRMGIGLSLSSLAMVVSVVVEIIRRNKAIREGNSKDMSALWLLPQCCLLGLAEALTASGQIEFLYKELPSNMSSVAVALLEPGTTIATWLSDAVSKAVVGLTSERGKEMNWNDISKAPFDYYYSFLAIMNLINLLYFLHCSRSYGPCREQCEENGATLDDT